MSPVVCTQPRKRSSTTSGSERRLGRKQIGEGGHRVGHPSSCGPGVTGVPGAGCRPSREHLTIHTRAHRRAPGRACCTPAAATCPTPVFMPVATHANIPPRRRRRGRARPGARILLGNTYHLMLRPGRRGVRAASAASTASCSGTGRCSPTRAASRSSRLPEDREITEKGAHFRSFHDNSRQLLSPETQHRACSRRIGSDIMMVLDVCIDSTTDEAGTREAMERTHRWALRSLAAAQTRGHRPGALRHRAGRRPPRAARRERGVPHPAPVRRLRHRRAGGGRDEATSATR